VHRPKLAQFRSIPQVADAFVALANDPTVSTLISISPFIEAFGFPDESAGDVEKVLACIQSAPPDEDDEITVLAPIGFGAYRRSHGERSARRRHLRIVPRTGSARGDAWIDIRDCLQAL
jgi:hypothetical protein